MYTKNFAGVPTHPRAERYLAAGEVLEMEPAGLMWSVVTLSPRFRRTAAFSMSLTGGSSLVWGRERERVGGREQERLQGKSQCRFQTALTGYFEQVCTILEEPYII